MTQNEPYAAYQGVVCSIFEKLYMLQLWHIVGALLLWSDSTGAVLSGKPNVWSLSEGSSIRAKMVS